MGLLDGIDIANSAMSVHRFRSEVAAENIANVHTPGYRRQEVDLKATSFATALSGATSAGSRIGSGRSGFEANDGAVEISRVRAQLESGDADEVDGAELTRDRTG